MSEKGPVSRRGMFGELVRSAFRFAKEVREPEAEAEAREGDALLSFDSLPILHTYPWELFEDEAKRLGIDVEKVGKDEAIRLIVANQYMKSSDEAPA